MSADTTSKIDVTRAIGVLNAAMRVNMFPEGSIPETDTDKIIAAEQIIELARQAHTIAQNIGKGNVPKYDDIMAVLAEAEVFMGIDSPPGPASPTVASNAPAEASPAIGDERGTAATQDSASPAAVIPPSELEVGHIDVQLQPSENKIVFWHTGCDGSLSTWWSPLDDVPPPAVGSTRECANCAYIVPITAVSTTEPYQGLMPYPEPVPVEQSTATGDASFTADPAAVPQQPATPDPTGVEYPQEDETWIDGTGGQWFIEANDGGGGQLQIKSVTTGESTLAPHNFLTMRAAVASATTPTQEASPSPPPPSSSPSGASLLPAQPAQPSPEPLVSPAPPTPSIASSGGGSVPSPSSSTEPPVESPPQQSGPEPVAPTDDDEGDPEYRALLEQVESDYLPTAMPVPMDLEDPPELATPDDLTMIGDLEQRKLHSQYNALSARARYLFGLENAKAKRTKRVRKKYMKVAMREARSQLGKDASVTEVTNLAEENEGVAPWIAREERHTDRADAYRTFFDMYAENVSVLSRDWTMREQEQRGS